MGQVYEPTEGRRLYRRLIVRESRTVPSSSVVILGMWLGVIGYGLLYSGMRKLNGDTCGVLEAFQNKCVPKPAGGGIGGPYSGQTIHQQKLSLLGMQSSWIQQQVPIRQR